MACLKKRCLRFYVRKQCWVPVHVANISDDDKDHLGIWDRLLLGPWTVTEIDGVFYLPR